MKNSALFLYFSFSLTLSDVVFIRILPNYENWEINIGLTRKYCEIARCLVNREMYRTRYRSGVGFILRLVLKCFACTENRQSVTERMGKERRGDKGRSQQRETQRKGVNCETAAAATAAAAWQQPRFVDEIRYFVPQIKKHSCFFMCRYLHATINDEICSPACGSLKSGPYHAKLSKRGPRVRRNNLSHARSIYNKFFFFSLFHTNRKTYFFIRSIDGLG